MPMKQYKSDNTDILYKIIKSRQKGNVIAIGIAFRTRDAPIGYFPFYGINDFDFSGTTSLKEELMARFPINLSSAGSPHSLLIREAAGDVEFLGSGDADLTDIQRLVKIDLLRHAMVCASGVLVDGVMMALGGPAIKSVINQLFKSSIKQFIISKAISNEAKKFLKDQGNIDAGKLLTHAP